MRLAIYVQHLLGTGHLVRMMKLAEALHQNGDMVLLVSGGKISDTREIGYSVLQLPVLKVNQGDFTNLLNEAGEVADNNIKSDRAVQLRLAIQRFCPDVLLLETFPFGRRQMRFELMPLMEAVSKMTPRPLVISSIRDILQQRKSKRNLETLELLRSYFDAVLVHGDPNFVALANSFPPAEEIAVKVHYTGYITDSPTLEESEPNHRDGLNEVIVSAGGGAVGSRLLRSAIEARPLSRLKHLTWRILVGENLPREQMEDLYENNLDGIVIESNRSDFPVLLSRCRLSISQAGYNSCLDLIRAGVKSVLVPFVGQGETEQTQRATMMQHNGLATLISEAQLTPSTLAAAVDHAQTLSPNKNFSLDMNGVENSISIIHNLYEDR